MAVVGFSPVTGGTETVSTPGSLGRLNRPPTVDDNSAKGYTATTDVWNYKGRLYSPMAAPDTNSAVWAELNSANGPTGGLTDIVTGDGGTVAAAYGLYAVKSGFTGACFDYSATVNGGTVTGTINIVAGGELDQSAMGALMSKADAGTKVVVTKWYDQNGTNHATRAAANGLFIDWDEVLQCYVLTGDIDATTDRSLTIPAGVTLLNTRAYSMHYIGRSINTAAKGDAIYGALGALAGTLNYHGNSYTTSPDSVQCTVSVWQTSQNFRAPTTAVPSENGPCIIQFLPQAGSTIYWCNENTGTNSTAPTSATLTDGGSIGGFPGVTNRYPAMRYAAVIVTSTVMTAATAKKIRYATYRRFGIKPQAKDNVVFVGDSRMQGTNQKERNHIPFAVQARLKYPARCITVANSGWSSASFTTGATSTLAAINTLYNSTRKNVIVYWTGVNDFIVDNLTAAQSYTNIKANVATLKAAGWYVILLMEADTTNTTNNANTRIDTLRGLMADGTHGADELLDLSVYTPWTAASNSTYWPDGLHQSTGISEMAASKIADRVDIQLAAGQAL